MTGYCQGVLFIFLHHGRIADDVSKKNGGELAVWLFHVLRENKEQEYLTRN